VKTAIRSPAAASVQSTCGVAANVTGNTITKPMLITAFGARRISPSVIQAHDRAEANSRTSAIAASTPAAPPAGR